MRLALIAATALLWGSALAAQTAPSELQFPTYPLGPPVVALGGAGAAWPHDAAASINPATLLNAPRVSVYHYEGFADYGGDHAAGSVRLSRRLALGISLRRFGWDRVIEDDVGVPTAGLRTGDAQYSLTLALAPARAIHVGVAAARLLSDNLGVRIDATSWSFGVLTTYARSGHLGIALLHAGTAARGSGGDRYALPTRIRAGIQEQVLNRVTVVMDGAWPIQGAQAWSAHAGLEWRAPAFLILRAGLESLASAGAVERDSRFASGLGLVVGPLEVSLTTRFGGITGSQEWFVGLDALRPQPSPPRPTKTPKDP